MLCFQNNSIVNALYMVFELMMSVCIGRVMVTNRVTNQSGYRKGLKNCNPFLCGSNTMQSALESGQ